MGILVIKMITEITNKNDILFKQNHREEWICQKCFDKIYRINSISIIPINKVLDEHICIIKCKYCEELDRTIDQSQLKDGVCAGCRIITNMLPEFVKHPNGIIFAMDAITKALQKERNKDGNGK